MTKAGRPIKVSEEINQIRFLIENEEHEELKRLLDSFGIDVTDEDKRTALIWASYFNNVELLKWLIDRNANINSQDYNGYSALHFCAQEKNIEAAKVLLESGADPNKRDSHDNSPLWTSVFNSKGEFEIVKLLIKYGALPDEKNLHGRSPNDLSETIYELKIDDLIET